jgi:hypothetical protein
VPVTFCTWIPSSIPYIRWILPTSTTAEACYLPQQYWCRRGWVWCWELVLSIGPRLRYQGSHTLSTLTQISSLLPHHHSTPHISHTSHTTPSLNQHSTLIQPLSLFHTHQPSLLSPLPLTARRVLGLLTTALRQVSPCSAERRRCVHCTPLLSSPLSSLLLTLINHCRCSVWRREDSWLVHGRTEGTR